MTSKKYCEKVKAERSFVGGKLDDLLTQHQYILLYTRPYNKPRNQVLKTLRRISSIKRRIQKIT